mmetsp:Transcript_23698/g.32280  ORF Transcript_23698/g.32280 Transcript_23698/m.32280 type:complete len:125 (-) Transcript_23698:865-1239(-)|eukprot:scaffold81102_cov32-Tisochrysis_lutea.AAC.2
MVMDFCSSTSAALRRHNLPFDRPRVFGLHLELKVTFGLGLQDCMDNANRKVGADKDRRRRSMGEIRNGVAGNSVRCGCWAQSTVSCSSAPIACASSQIVLRLVSGGDGLEVEVGRASEFIICVG